MTSSFSLVALAGALLMAALPHPAADAQQSLSDNERARYLSFAVRDRPLSLDEAKALHAGEVTIDTLLDGWLDTEATEARVERWFNDLFGNASDEGVLVIILLRTEDGAAYRAVDGPCSADEAVQKPVWWSDTPDLLCPGAADETGYLIDEGPGGEEVFYPCQFVGQFRPECGCGPDGALCLPIEQAPEYFLSGLREPARRGWWAYANDRSWLDWLGGDTLWADRFLYHWYLALRFRLPMDKTGVLAEFRDELMAVPLYENTELPFPDQGPEYAGFITGPGYLAQNNNFRSRIRVLTEQLLCADVGYQLNVVSDEFPSGIDTFLNPDHDELTLTHAEPDCAGCHYPMDNLGSTLFGFGPTGSFDEAPEARMSTVGYVFGEVGEGPRFLARGYIERGQGLHECLAKRAWEDFAGESWDALNDAQRAEIVTWAEAGPRTLLRELMVAEQLRAQR